MTALAQTLLVDTAKEAAKASVRPAVISVWGKKLNQKTSDQYLYSIYNQAIQSTQPIIDVLTGRAAGMYAFRNLIKGSDLYEKPKSWVLLKTGNS